MNILTTRRGAPRRRTGSVLAVLAAVLAVILGGCGGGKTAAGTTDTPAKTDGTGGTLTIGMTLAQFPSLDTVEAGLQGYEGVRFVASQLYDALVEYDLTSADKVPTIKPSLATSWSNNDDATVWTFKLRSGVTFTDGTPFDAEAVAFNLERYLHPESKYSTPILASQAASFVGLIKSWRKVDDMTIELTTSEPDGHLLDDLSHMQIASPAAVKKDGAAGFAKHPVGSGPFKLESITANQQLVLVRNDDYWGTPAKLDKLVLRPIPDPGARVAALLSGGVDWIEYPNPDDIPQLKSAGYQIFTNSYDHLWFWMLDETKPPFNDVRVRQAVNYAIDRDAIAKNLLNGTAQPAEQASPRGTLAYDPANDMYNYDPEKAKQLLKEAGFKPGTEITVAVPTAGSGNLLPVPISEAIQQNLADVGFKVKIRTIEWGAMLGFIGKNKAPFDAEATAGSTTNWNPESFLPFNYASYAPYYNGHYGNKKFDALIKQAARTPDQTKKWSLYTDAMKLVTEDASRLFVVNDLNPRALAKDVHGFVEPQSWFVDLKSVWVGK